jgi:hypothetical protein
MEFLQVVTWFGVGEIVIGGLAAFGSCAGMILANHQQNYDYYLKMKGHLISSMLFLILGIATIALSLMVIGLIGEWPYYSFWALGGK